jgi:hypothetical protein
VGTERALAITVAVEWLATSATFLTAAADRALARRRADAAVAAAQGWVWHRPLHVEGYGGPLDLSEAATWWRNLQRENERERQACQLLDGLGMGA